MILVADSGSTKCDWALIDENDKITEFQTMGFNPLFHSEDLIVETLRKNQTVEAHSKKVTSLYYFGTGTGSEALRLSMQTALKKVFPFAEKINSHTDLQGAALATYEGTSCIACILGTGANACFYDGQNLEEKNPALGFILGDEGSGAFFGKKLLAAYLYHQLPPYLMAAFEEQYGLNKEIIIEKIYKTPRANVFLASFMPFFHAHRTDEFINKILRNGFRQFFLNHVLCFQGYRNLPVHFVGSVAYFFSAELLIEANRLGITLGQIVPRPIEKLKGLDWKSN